MTTAGAERRTVDRHGLGRLGFGGAPIGSLYAEVPAERAFATLEAAWAAGIRYFDTAPHYGLGLSERRLGEFLRTKPRDEYRISTKVGRRLEPNPAFTGGRDLANGFDVPDDLVRVFDPSADGVRRSLDASLERLGLDRVDVVYLHDPDAYDLDRGLAEGLPALAGLRAEGLVDAVGVGVNSADAAVRAVREGALDLVMIAGRYTLLEQPAAAELLPECLERGVGVVAVGVFNSGLLARAEPPAEATYNYGPAPAELLERTRRIAAICREHGVDLPTAAVHFPLRHPAVGTILLGAARPEHVLENAARLEREVPESLWAALADAEVLR